MAAVVKPIHQNPTLEEVMSLLSSRLLKFARTCSSRPRVYLWLVCNLMTACILHQASSAQDYLQEVARPTFSQIEPVELGVVDVANGNMHLEVPLASFPQRGSRPLTYKLVYDSRIWYPYLSPGWGLNSWATAMGGWRFSTSVDPGVAGPNNGGNCNSVVYATNYSWTAPDGTAHFFPITTSPAGGCYPQNGSASAQDSSGYFMYASGGGTVNYVLAPDGTQVYPYVKDTNGNYFSSDANGNVIDTLGRTPVIVTKTCNGNANEICYDILNSKGSTSRVTVMTETISVHTAFNQPSKTEYSGTLTVIQSIQLPDGTYYQFGYDSGSTAGHYGEVTSVTLPTSGQATYAYSVFQDAGGSYNHWLSQHTRAGGTWTYTPGNVNTTNKTQSLTVLKPSGDQKYYSFTLNNGAWLNSLSYIQSSGGNPRNISLSWDTSNSCTSPCYGSGAIYVRKLGETITTDNVNKTTSFSYSSTANSLPATVKEWNYYSGSQPATPNRITNITYLSDNNSAYGPAGKNILNRPASIVVTDGNSIKLKETDYGYDTTSLTSVTGVAKHDDNNFGTGDTTRGNRTTISAWLNGTTFVPEATLTYDTTGQMVQATDAKSNLTTFSYADCYANDNGQNPPSTYTPSQRTNAYPTLTTLPVSGTLKSCYYFGTGKTAWNQDQNGATTYRHFLDVDDRETNDYFPIGWLLNVYTSSTQVDTYLGIQDSTLSANCSSCRHDEAQLDNLGRTVDQILVSDPDGQTTTQTDYDSNGRVLDTSHPYRSTSDSTYGLETVSYDGLDRPVKVTHQDGTTRKIYYGKNVTGGGGLTAQRCTSCQLGYPTLTVDEVGKVRQVWTDAFGKTVEVDEPAATSSAGGSGAGTGTITFSGSEQSTQVQYTCGPNGQQCYRTVYDGGIFTVTVDGVSEQVSWGSGSSATTLASSTASAFNSDPASPVSASASGAVVTFSSSFNYALGPASTSWNTQYFTNPSFSSSFSGANMTGGVTPQMSSPTTTYYLYDLLGNLTQVTVMASQECNRTYVYDALSRMTSSTEPEPGNGACTNSSHTTNYYYTASGGGQCSGSPSLVCRRTDSRSITTTYGYDALNRPTGMTYSDSTHSVTYSYDQTSFNGLTIANGLGRRTGMIDASGQTAWSYDPNGNIVKEERTIASVTKTISYAYNGDNSLKQITYPSGRVVNFTVGNAQRTTAVTDGTGTQYVQAPTSGWMYAPTGALASAVYGKGTNFTNGLTESRSYNNRLQITAISASSSAGNALNLAYAYTGTGHTNNNSEILAITNGNDNGRSQTMAYDDLGRIAQATSQATSGADCWGQSFTIDAVANLTGITTTQCSGSSLNAPVNQNNQFNTGYTYDAAGNLVNDGLYAYTYNAENEMITGNGATYTYDGNRMRVEKSSGVLYWRTTGGAVIAETNTSGTNVNEYLFFAGRRTVQRDNSGNLYYYQADQVQSTRSITKVPTSGSAIICYDADFTPYGAEMNPTSKTSCAPNYKFTGYERDSETGLDYAFNRHYDSRAGRFMSPDPAGHASTALEGPQSLNRYAYVLNNPMSAFDPSGLECVWDDGSYDSEDDASTGTPGSCQGNGGSWIELGQLGNWSGWGNFQLAQDVALLQMGAYNTMTEIGADGNVWVTHYTSPVDGQTRVDWTDAGGVVTGYGYFGNAVTPALSNVIGYDPTNAFGQYVRNLVQAEGLPQTVQDFNLWQMSGIIAFDSIHIFGHDLNSSMCEGLAALSMSALFMTGPEPVWPEAPIWLGWGFKGFGVSSMITNATVCK